MNNLLGKLNSSVASSILSPTRKSVWNVTGHIGAGVMWRPILRDTFDTKYTTSPLWHYIGDATKE